MTETKNPTTTVAQDVAALRAVLNGQHAQTETPAEVLASCPFCGHHAHYDSHSDWVSCDGCGATGPTGDDQVSAIDAWNSRSLAAGKVATDGCVLVRESMLRHWLREVNNIRNGSISPEDAAEHVHASISAVLGTAPPADPAKASGSARWPIADEEARKDGWTWDYEWLKSLHLAAHEAGWTTTMEGIDFVLSKIATPPASAPEVTDAALFDDALAAAFEKYPHAHDGLTFFACAIRGPRQPTPEDLKWAKSEVAALQQEGKSHDQ